MRASPQAKTSGRWVGWAVLLLLAAVLGVAQTRGNTRAMAPQIMPVPSIEPSCADLIVNGGFETLTGPEFEAEPWVRGGNVVYTDFTANTGANSAFLGGDNDAAHALLQQVTLPGDALPASEVISATLRFWWGGLTDEVDHPHDYMYVRVYDSAFELLDELWSVSDADVGIGAWTAVELDMLAYKGQTVHVTFEAATDAQNATAFFVDDVALEVCQVIQPTPTPTATNTVPPSPTSTNTPVPSATPTVSPTPHSVTLTWTEGGYQGTVDSWLDGWYPDTNYGNDSDMWIRSADIKRPVIYFDVSSIPAGSTIVGARLWLMTDFYRSHPQTINVAVYGLKRAWNETQVTWNRAQVGALWAAPGADNTASDRDSVAADTRPIYDTVKWYDWNVTSLVQQWVSGGRTNHGMLLVGTGNTCEMHFWTSECSVAGQRPRLEVQYVPGTAPTATRTAVPSATPTTGPSATPTLPVGGAEIVLQRGLNGYSGLVDTHISEWQPADNFGPEPRLAVRQNGVRSALLRFDLSSVPAGIDLIDARVEMYCVKRSNTAPMTISVTRLVKWFAPRQANWTRATGLLLWGIPGCKEPAVDLARRATSSTLVSTVEDWHSWDVTPLVQLWLDGARNNGMIFTGAGAASVEYSYYASDSTWNADRTPRLVIRYAP